MEFLGTARFCRGSPDSGLVELWKNLGLHLYSSAVVCYTNTDAPEHACTLHVFLKKAKVSASWILPIHMADALFSIYNVKLFYPTIAGQSGVSLTHHIV